MVRRILEFNQWKSSNIIVIHMQKSSHMVSTSLEELGIPFIEIEYEDGNALGEFLSYVDGACGVIIGGGVLDQNEAPPSLPKEIAECPIPKLGICLGHEILGIHLGAGLIPCNGGFGLGESSEVIATIHDEEIFEGLEDAKKFVKMEHYLMLDRVPNGARLLASTKMTPVAGFHHDAQRIWGLQFHPEKDWIKGIVLKNFYNICLAYKKV